MHIVLVYRYYNDGIVYYNLTFCTKKSLMTDLGYYNFPFCKLRFSQTRVHKKIPHLQSIANAEFRNL